MVDASMADASLADAGLAEASTVEESIKQKAHKAAERAREKAKHIVEEQKPKMERAESAIKDYSPSVFLGLSLASIVSSMVLFFRKSKDNAMFVGLWAPTFLALGMFFTLIGVRKKR